MLQSRPFAEAHALAQVGKNALLGHLHFARRTSAGPFADFRPQDWRRISDTFFILGSGPSINHLSSRQWDEIGRADSIGLNRWPVHPFIPTAYSCEWTPRSAGNPIMEQIAAWHRYRARDYDVAPPILIKVPATRRDYAGPVRLSDIETWIGPELGHQVVLTRDLRFAPKSFEGFRAVVRSLARVGALRGRGLGPMVLNFRASVLWAVFLGLRLGYARIVLCGVDLLDTSYFWTDDPERFEVPDLPLPVTGQDQAVHRNVDSVIHPVALDEALVATAEAAREFLGASVVLGTGPSLLQDRLEAFVWRDAGKR